MDLQSPTLAMIGSVPQMLIVAAVVILVFGAKKVHLLARGLARSPVEFMKGKREGLPPAKLRDEED